MPLSYFADKDSPPSVHEILEVLGSRRSLWESLDGFVCEQLSAHSELKFYGKSYGWMLWYRRGTRTLVAFYPQQDAFVVQVVLPENLVEQVLQMGLGANAQGVIEKTELLREGRWLYIKVETEGDCQDIQKLLLARWKPITQSKR